jgi:hypothetical protein
MGPDPLGTRFGESCETPRHLFQHLLVWSGLGLRVVADRMAHAAADKYYVARGEMQGPPLTDGMQPARPPQNDMDVSLGSRIDLKAPGRDQLRLRDHRFAHPGCR